MGLRTKFNLLLLAAALIGIGLFALASTPLLREVAREEVLQSSRIMMESAAGTRKYTSEQIAPLLATRMQHTFHPQAVSAYAAKNNFAVLHANFPDFSYREAALNPTNLEDKATDWETDIIDDFRAHPLKREIVAQRASAIGAALTLARPVVAAPACLECHSTPAAAPESMVAIYGGQHGFGWTRGEIIGAQIVTVPMSAPFARAAHLRVWFILAFSGVFLMLLVLLNILLSAMVLGPIHRIAETAEAVSLGNLDAPEYVHGGSDQIAGLSASFNRMRRSLSEALRMLGHS